MCCVTIWALFRLKWYFSFTQRLKKERITNLKKELNYDKMREILRKLGYNKYFEHIQYINSIFGIKPLDKERRREFTGRFRR